MAEKLNLLSTVAGDLTKPEARISYPINLFEGHTDYVKFDFYNYKGPFSGDGGGGSTDTEGTALKNTNLQLDIYNQRVGEQYKRYPGAKTILMYMPEDISTGYGGDWGGKNFSNTAANTLRTSGSALAGDGGATIGNFVEAIKTAGGALPTVAAQSLATAISAVGNDSISTNDVLQGSLGVVLNPNTELMFQGFKPRTFSLKYKMSARNGNEAKMITQIIGTFKKVALPRFGQAPRGSTDAASLGQLILNSVTGGKDKEASNANYIGVPGLCNVQFMKGTTLHEHLPQYKICAITDVSINYTPDGTYNTYGDGRPVAVELSLTFAETKLVYSQEINIEGLSY